LVLSASAPLACGGGNDAAKPLDFQVQLKDTSAERCLKSANLKRERKPTEPAKITVRHVLVKYAGAKRAEPSVGRTREQACLRAAEAYQKLSAGTDFEKIVEAYSDEAGAATRGGSIGAIERRDVAPPFADAAFELDLNQASEVVESDFGFHIILRTD
jgi:parvulin-like peptidyl-prolyl isomerase